MSALNIARSSQQQEDSMISLKTVHLVSASLLAIVVLFSNSSAFAQIDLSGDWAVRIQEDQTWRGPGIGPIGRTTSAGAGRS